MQQLHLVGFTTDLDHLILSARKGAKSGSFLVPLDERLLDEIAEAIRRRNDGTAGAPLVDAPAELTRASEPARRSSLLSPREIQARLRAGRSIPDVAVEAVADEDWVAKFSPPVMAERGRIITTVRELTYNKPRRGESAEPLGVAVRWNLFDRGVRLTDDEFESCWSAYHVADSAWAVTFDYVSRGRRQHAEWEVDLRDGEVIARNRVASDLGYVETVRRRRLSALQPDPPKQGAKSGSSSSSSAASGRGGESGKSASSAASAASSSTRSARSTKSARATKSAKSKSRSTKSARSTKPTKSTKAAAKSRPKARAKPATKPGSSAKKVTRAKAAGRAKKSSAASKRSGGSSRSRTGAPPALVPASAREVAARPPADELTRRRLELIRAARAAEPTRPRGAGPARPSIDRRPSEATPRRVAAPRAAEPEPVAEPAAAVAREATMSFPRPNTDRSEPAPAVESEEAARRRREERRKARAQAREASSPAPSPTPRAVAAPPPAAPQALPPAPASAPPPRSVPRLPTRPAAADDGDDQPAVVTIRAARAGDGDVIVPGGRPALRPALPAAQPKRRRRSRGR